MAPEQLTALVRRFFDEVCNGRQLAVADELFAPDHLYHDPAIPAEAGPAGMRQVLAPYHAAFADAHWQVDAMLVAEEETVVTRWTASGTQTGDLPGIPATGRWVSVPGIWLHRIAAGQIAESWNVWGTLSLLQQLGAVPAPAHLTESEQGHALPSHP